jgi:small subunit ribosomal protein S8
MVNDLIGDSLIRIKNATVRGKVDVELRHSKLVEEICRILKENKRIDDYEIGDSLVDSFRVIKVKLNDPTDVELEKIRDVKRVSRPGLRIYRGYREIKPVLEGYGFAILTTPKGVLTDSDARDKKVGGEVICEIY